jgi:hypothetical protein
MLQRPITGSQEMDFRILIEQPYLTGSKEIAEWISIGATREAPAPANATAPRIVPVVIAAAASG